MVELKKIIEDMGVSDYGFGNVRGLIPENWSDLDQSISIFVELSRPLVDDIKSQGPTKTYFAHYRAMNNYINEITLKIVMYLQKKGYRAVAIPASQTVSESSDIRGVFQHRTAATVSGKGWIGKSGMFIHETIGPSVRMGTVLTNFKLPVGSPVKEGKCGRCRECVIACPAMAIEGTEWRAGIDRIELYDAKACSDYMKESYMHIGRGSVCGICMAVCPFNKK
ncbi:4Fe-4S double cluster binding domain-containing protein [Alkalibacter mobilis]|uniref:4Fe-4S double cluster binding domain-containing protein n=1 Tax=Alkalibacter mobilis TaxID=2787712 RepID=UPI00189E2DC7|nr:4Fe-4S double cluster binding domain-containing protein [Alkalibacter mobilis]MBF7097728.1 epoxyqueuosine reductase [Alkalibacter mobilis]